MKISSLQILFVLGVLLISGSLSAQEDNHEHDHKANEISIALGVVPLLNENDIAAGLHVHYVRGVAVHNKLGLGVSFETILDEHRHYTYSAVIQYRVFKGLILGYSPGLMLSNEGMEQELLFVQHLETTYEFELNKFHLGPILELGLEKEALHLLMGIHFGIDF
jgi:hypothetical protein